MLFNSLEFIFVFLPIMIVGYFILNKFRFYKLSKILLIIGSLYFYSFYNRSYLLIILFSIIVNYFIGTSMYKENNSPNVNKCLLMLGIVFNIMLLGYFKYYDFIIGNINGVLGTNLNLIKVALPLGISFFTFQQISYIIDCYKKTNIKYDFLSYCLFVTFFPQLIAGPIVLPSEMLPQFEDEKKKSIDYENINRGMYVFAIGLAKKVIIADSIAKLANAGFSVQEQLLFIEAWVTSLAFTIQLYFDFSGYCDMARGIGLMFNIKLPLNFNSPYKSSNIQEFWQKWHITLGRFLTNYIYIPLGGNRLGKNRTLINLFIVFLISGIWHGAGWTFVIWGALHGLSIIIHRIWKNSGRKLDKYVGIFVTFNLVNILWVFFRANTVGQAINIIKSMFDITTISINFSTEFIKYAGAPRRLSLLLAVLILAAIILPNTYKKEEEMKFNVFNRIEMVVYICLSLVILISNSVSTFLYFNF